MGSAYLLYQENNITLKYYNQNKTDPVLKIEYFALIFLVLGFDLLRSHINTLTLATSASNSSEISTRLQNKYLLIEKYYIQTPGEI